MNRITTCPHCASRLNVSEQINDKTLICPRCLAEVANPQPGFQTPVPDINTDVERDLKMGNDVLAVLIVVCILGIAMAIFVVNRGEAKAALIMFSSAALCILIPLAILRTGSVRTCGIVFLLLGTFMAIFIFVVFTCLRVRFPVGM